MLGLCLGLDFRVLNVGLSDEIMISVEVRCRVRIRIRIRFEIRLRILD